jgi:meiotically up-regulated gene 157 (Mug157) protein
LPFNIPANALAVVCLRHIAEMLTTLRLASHHATEARRLADEIDTAIRRLAIVPLSTRGAVLAYEVDGFGSQLVMDDANVPSLLSLPYLGWCPKDDRLYKRTRALILSPDNPYYCAGTAGVGVGSPHIGSGWIWPLGVIMQAITSESDDEIRACLLQLKSSHGGAGFMHESYWQDDPAQFTRHWFAWANSLFGELILTLHAERPHLLRARF